MWNLGLILSTTGLVLGISGLTNWDYFFAGILSFVSFFVLIFTVTFIQTIIKETRG